MENIRWNNSESEAILKKKYLLKGETVHDAIERVASSVARRFPDKKELYGNVKESIIKGWMSLSSPIWANQGTDRGLPISCYNVHISDSIESLSRKTSEITMQTKHGGGTSAYIDMRAKGEPITNNGKTNGPVAFMKITDSIVDVISQGSTRKGACAFYMDINHKDILDFINVKSVGSEIQNLFTAVVVDDEFIKKVDIDRDKEAMRIWAKVLQSRQQKGIPYILHRDNVNRNKPEIYKKLNLDINASNLCSEIMLPSTDDESFICCLLSMNFELIDEWRDTHALETALYTLDAVLSDFIDKTENMYGFESTHKFAKRHRAVGIGALGYHSYLQANNIPFESNEARAFNRETFKFMRESLDSITEDMAVKYGPAPIYNEVPDGEIVKRRHTVTMAVAPTTTSSAILGQVSAGIEPYSSNYYKAGLAAGNFIRKNKYLQKVLEAKGLDTEEVWETIMVNKGSVQHLDGLTDHEKAVFKTFKEISQKEIIIQACNRQLFIDQGQSLNLNIPPDLPIKDVNSLIMDGLYGGIKAFYYQRSQSVTKEELAGVVKCGSCEA